MLLDVLSPTAAIYANRGLTEAWRATTVAVPRARRFAFDTEASTFLGAFIRDCGDLIIANRQFALPPFQTTYLEVDMAAMIKAIGKTTSGAVQPPWDPTDTQVGYLIDGDTITPVVDTGRGATISPIEYVMGGVGKPLIQVTSETPEQEEWVRMALMLGTTLHDIEGEDVRRDILDANTCRILVEDLPPKTLHALLYGSFGDLRNVWAALLLLKEVTATRGIHRGKLKAYAAHHTVAFNLEKVREIRHAIDRHYHDRRSPRRHEVRGHFMHFNLAEGCEHAWSALPDRENRWTCLHCGGRRTWRKDFLRGDAGVGFVSKDYTAV